MSKIRVSALLTHLQKIPAVAMVVMPTLPLLPLTCLPQTASAQQGCQYVPQGTNGDFNFDCSGNVNPPVVRPLLFAAFAFSPSTQMYGTAWAYPSQGDAQTAAFLNCRKAAGDCKAVMWSSGNICIALAISSSDGGYGTSGGNTRKKAVAAAMRECEESNGDTCHVDKEAVICPND